MLCKERSVLVDVTLPKRTVSCTDDNAVQVVFYRAGEGEVGNVAQATPRTRVSSTPIRTRASKT